MNRDTNLSPEVHFGLLRQRATLIVVWQPIVNQADKAIRTFICLPDSNRCFCKVHLKYTVIIGIIKSLQPKFIRRNTE
jgi:hypothetical protein